MNRSSEVKEPILTDWLTKQVERSSWGEKIAKDLARADLKLKPGEYIAIMVIVAFAMFVVVWYIGGRYIPVGLIGAVVGGLFPEFM